jgi:phosphinothricin acetyltransferase
VANLQVSTQIQAPVEEVWASLADVSSHVDWMLDARAIRFTTAQRTGVGTEFDCVTGVGPLRLTDRMRITEWRPHEAMGVRHSGLVTGTGRFTLEPVDAATTRFEWREQLRFPWWLGGKVGAAVAAPVLRLVWRTSIDRLRRTVEAARADRRRPRPAPAVVLRDAVVDDLPAILDLNNTLIPTTTVAWTTTLETLEERQAWFAARQAAGKPVLVAVDEASGDVVGFSTYGDFRDTTRWPGYRHTAEQTIHVREDHHGTGVGRMLVEALLDRARADGIHVMVAGVDAENEGSVRFHERLGFVEVARMPQVGRKFERWLDLVLLQKVLDP